MLARVDAPIMNWFHSDVVQVENLSESWGYKNKDWKIWTPSMNQDLLVPGTFNPEMDKDGNHILKDEEGKEFAKMPPNGHYFDRIEELSMSLEIKKQTLMSLRKQ